MAFIVCISNKNCTISVWFQHAKELFNRNAKLLEEQLIVIDFRQISIRGSGVFYNIYIRWVCGYKINRFIAD